jgi:hypothetical protein
MPSDSGLLDRRFNSCAFISSTRVTYNVKEKLSAIGGQQLVSKFWIQGKQKSG